MVDSDSLAALSHSHLRGILATLDAAAGAHSASGYREAVVSGVRSMFGCRDVTFFAGVTYADLFDDPAPVLSGDIVRLVDEWRDRWKSKDIFAGTAARRLLVQNGFASLDQLRALPSGRRAYVEDYLRPNRMLSASAIHIRFADGEALVGMFDAGFPWVRRDVEAARTLARHLNLISRGFRVSPAIPGLSPGTDSRCALESLTQRRWEVARLVSTGMSNVQIADHLCLTEGAVKKHLGRIFEQTGLRNRAALTAAVLRGEGRPGTGSEYP